MSNRTPLNLTVAHFITVNSGEDWIVLQGDKQHLNYVFIGSTKSEKNLQKELLDLCYDDLGDFIAEVITVSEARQLIQDGAYLISCGFLS